MGRTVPLYSLASDREKRKWKVFREQLDKSRRKFFGEMMHISRLYNVAGVGSCKPVLLYPIRMSIIFEHYRQLEFLRTADPRPKFGKYDEFQILFKVCWPTSFNGSNKPKVRMLLDLNNIGLVCICTRHFK